MFLQHGDAVKEDVAGVAAVTAAAAEVAGGHLDPIQVPAHEMGIPGLRRDGSSGIQCVSVREACRAVGSAAAVEWNVFFFWLAALW